MDLNMAQTPKEIRAFQARNTDWLGRPLVADGVVGPKTTWALAISGLESRRRRSTARAVLHVGLTERGVNRHPLIDSWLTRCGVPLGLPWCAAWLSWVLSVADAEPIRIAGAVRLGLVFQRVPENAPVQAGDIIWFGTNTPIPGSGHCEYVIGVGVWEEHELLATIGGNVSNGVRAHMRRRSEVNVARPFPAPFLGAIVDLPRLPDGSPALTYVQAHSAGTR
jgi:hypothetical protein